MVVTNSKKPEGLQKLISIMDDKDHWDMLDQLALSLNQSAQLIEEIRNSMEMRDVALAREALPDRLVTARIFMEIIIVQLSIMPDEWNKEMDRQVEKLIKENTPTFDNMDF